MDRRVDLAGTEVIEDLTAAIMRELSPAEKMHMLDQMVEFRHHLAAAGVRMDHPEWSEDEVRREAARRLAGVAV